MNSVRNLKEFIFQSTKRKVIAGIVVMLVVFLVGKHITGGAKTPTYQTATAANGIVSHVYVKSGDTVTAGETIADLTLDIAGQQKQAQAWASYLSAKSS